MIWILCIFALFFSSCEQKPQEVQYKEIAPASVAVSATMPVSPVVGSSSSVNNPHAGMDMSAMAGLIEAPTSQNILVWTTPEGWQEEPGKHMRMASFHALADPKAIDCSIIALGGPAGGLEANLSRWMGQIGLDPSQERLKQLSAHADTVVIKDGLTAQVFDFAFARDSIKPTDPSILVAMVAVNQTTVFVKMTGSIRGVAQNKDNFLKLLQSIARK